jgi:hypothetical protein
MGRKNQEEGLIVIILGKNNSDMKQLESWVCTFSWPFLLNTTAEIICSYQAPYLLCFYLTGIK